ncbi:MAG: ubiquinone biosynthesis accessory factor UbiJ [Sulfuriferula sp.]
MIFTLHNRAMAAVLNHLLGNAPWARLKMMQHAGKRVDLIIFPLHLRFEIDSEGWLRQNSSHTADATIRLQPLRALRIALGDTAATHEIDISGDTQLAASFGNMLLNLDWDAEADLSHLVGDIAAHQITQAAQHFIRWKRSNVEEASAAFMEYATEESPLLAKRHNIVNFIAEIDTLRDSHARLQKRIELIAQRLPSH